MIPHMLFANSGLVNFHIIFKKDDVTEKIIIKSYFYSIFINFNLQN